jgi:hypothetical protein
VDFCHAIAAEVKNEMKTLNFSRWKKFFFLYRCSSIGFSDAASNGTGCSSSGKLMSLARTTETFVEIRVSHSSASFV